MPNFKHNTLFICFVLTSLLITACNSTENEGSSPPQPTPIQERTTDASDKALNEETGSLANTEDSTSTIDGQDESIQIDSTTIGQTQVQDGEDLDETEKVETPSQEESDEITTDEEIKSVTFSMEEINRAISTDIPQEIIFFADGSSISEEGYCFYSTEPHWLIRSSWVRDFNKEYTGNLEAGEILQSATCGWQEGETIKTTVTKADGSQEILEIVLTADYPHQTNITGLGVYGIIDLAEKQAESDSQFMYEIRMGSSYAQFSLNYHVALGDPVGEYTISLASDTQEITHHFIVEAPNDARAFNEGYGNWRLYNFDPNEPILLALYGKPGSTSVANCLSKPHGDVPASCLIGSQIYQVDATGSLRLTLQHQRSDTAIVLIRGNHMQAIDLTEPVQTLSGREPISVIHIPNGYFPLLYDTLHSLNSTPINKIAGANTLVIKTVTGGAWYFVELENGAQGWIRIEEEYLSKFTSNDDLSTTSDTMYNEWVSVDAGLFPMGSTAQSAENIEKPVHDVHLNNYWIQRHEVSNANYSACVSAGICTPPSAVSSKTRSSYYGNEAFVNHPVIHITHSQAQTYCDWVDGRLPTEAEWEKAARQTDESYSLYTWGNEMEFAAGPIEVANFQSIIGDTTTVNDPRFLFGTNLIGLFNIHGNVWEWTADWFSPTYYANSPLENPIGPESGATKVVRGGSFSTTLRYISLTNRYDLDPTQGHDNVGFRCVRDIPPAP